MRQRDIRKLSPRDCAKHLGTLLLASQSRVGELVALWAAPGAPSLGALRDRLFGHFLTSPVDLVITMETLSFIGLDIPLRDLRPAELTCVHTLLSRHAEEPIFQSSVELQGFRLRYASFRYNSIMAQSLDRPLLVQMFAELCIAHAPPEHVGRVRSFIAGACGRGAREFRPRRHPCAKRLQDLEDLYRQK